MRDDGSAGLVGQDRASGGTSEVRRTATVRTAALYLALFVFGLAQAVVGAFFYGVGPAPLAALGFDLAIVGTCLLGGWGTGRASGGIAPAAGWLIAALVLGNGTASGTVVITAGTAGGVFLFGGAIGAAAAVVICFLLLSRRLPGPT